jgi:transposase
LLEGHCPVGAVAFERHQLAVDLVEELDRLTGQRTALRARIRTAVAASGTSLTKVFGVGEVIAATIIGHTGDIGRFPTADRVAAYNGTAPIEWSSGNPKRPTHRLSRRGNRTINHAIHIVAVTQLRHRHSPGRSFYDRKLAEGHTPREALRALKRRLSNVIYRHLVLDTATVTDGPGRASQETTPQACVAGPTS